MSEQRTNRCPGKCMGASSAGQFLLAVGLGVTSALGSVCAAEGASSRYLPGSLASAIDMTPPAGTFAARLSSYRYEGSIKDRQLQVPIAGLTATALDVELEQLAVSLIWNPGWETADGWSYAMGATIPYLTVDIGASLGSDSSSGSLGSERVSEQESGVGDLIFYPLMLSRTIERNWYSDVRLAIYAPTGSYEEQRLANVGKNYWTFSPTLALINIEPVQGREFSLYGGVDFHTQNTATNYHTGIQAHIESSLVQYVIALGGFTGVGVSGYWFQQLTADSGQGATLGDFKSQALGIGPVLSYRGKWSGIELMAELKWLFEFETKRYPEGDTVFFKLAAKY